MIGAIADDFTGAAELGGVADRYGLSAEVRNPLWSRHPMRIPGAKAGLIGLTERAELAGGVLEHGPTPEGEFVVRAWLPWPVEIVREDA